MDILTFCCRSGARSVASWKSGGAERWAEVAEKRWSGAEREAGGHEAGSGGFRNRLERGVGFSPLTLRSHHIDACYSVYSVVFWWMARWRNSSSYSSWCMKRLRAINKLENSRCALSMLVIARSQVVEHAFTIKGCTLEGLKGAWHRVVNTNNQCWHAGQVHLVTIRFSTGEYACQIQRALSC